VAASASSSQQHPTSPSQQQLLQLQLQQQQRRQLLLQQQVLQQQLMQPQQLQLQLYSSQAHDEASSTSASPVGEQEQTDELEARAREEALTLQARNGVVSIDEIQRRSRALEAQPQADLAQRRVVLREYIKGDFRDCGVPTRAAVERAQVCTLLLSSFFRRRLLLL
jgi:hypothetical protein